MQNHKMTGQVNLFKLNSTEDRLDALLNYREEKGGEKTSWRESADSLK